MKKKNRDGEKQRKKDKMCSFMFTFSVYGEY